MWVPFNVHNSRVPCCSMGAPRKTCFVSATWKRFLIIKLLLLTCMYPLFVGTSFGLLDATLWFYFICLWALYQQVKIQSIWNPPWCFFFFSKQQLRDTVIVWVQYIPCILLGLHIEYSISYLQSCARIMLFREFFYLEFLNDRRS